MPPLLVTAASTADFATEYAVSLQRLVDQR